MSNWDLSACRAGRWKLHGQVVEELQEHMQRLQQENPFQRRDYTRVT